MVTRNEGDQPYLAKAYLTGGHSDDRHITGDPNAVPAPDQGIPPETPSDEADRQQLEMARQEGEAYQRALLYMVHQVAHSGDQQRAGDYIVAYAQEEAEGMYRLRSEGELEWIEPEDENCHLEVSGRDAGDQRFIPHVSVEAAPASVEGEQSGPFEMPFL